MQHGMGGDPGVWMTKPLLSNTNLPMAVQFARMGHDIYCTGNRGTKYSQENDYYTIDQAEFWQMDWRMYGTYDFPAFVTEI